MCLEVWFIVSPCWKVRQILVLTLCSPLKWNYLLFDILVSSTSSTNCTIMSSSRVLRTQLLELILAAPPSLPALQQGHSWVLEVCEEQWQRLLVFLAPPASMGSWGQSRPRSRRDHRGWSATRRATSSCEKLNYFFQTVFFSGILGMRIPTWVWGSQENMWRGFPAQTCCLWLSPNSLWGYDWWDCDERNIITNSLWGPLVKKSPLKLTIDLKSGWAISAL